MIPKNKVGLLFPLNIQMEQHAVLIPHHEATLVQIRQRFNLTGGCVQIAGSTRAVMTPTALLDAGHIYYYIPPVKPRSIFSKIFGSPPQVNYPRFLIWKGRTASKKVTYSQYDVQTGRRETVHEDPSTGATKTWVHYLH